MFGSLRVRRYLSVPRFRPDVAEFSLPTPIYCIVVPGNTLYMVFFLYKGLLMVFFNENHVSQEFDGIGIQVLRGQDQP